MNADVLLEHMRVLDPAPDEALVRRAWDFALTQHGDQKRVSGEPYAVHLLGTALILADLGMDSVTIAAAILHDTLEDTDLTPEKLRAEFGPQITHIVEGVTKIGTLRFENIEQQQSENLRKMLLAMSDDLRVVLVKIADRTHNMRTLEFLAPEKRLRIARETMDVYAPLAHRLGIGALKAELEDLSFHYLHPEDFAHVKEIVEERKRVGAPFLARAQDQLRPRLAEAGVEAELSTRVKHYWSIWRKMRDRGKDMSEIYDIFGLRVLTQTLRDCYGSLGVVQTLWKPLPSRFKDYIAVPKSNLYQSLHTTVMTEGGELLEVQIRTAEMHRLAERGVAAHWRYKLVSGGGRVPTTSTKELAWISEITEWQKDTPSGPEFIEKFKLKLFEDEVFVFTPKGEVRSLPAGATPLDFAFEIHSDVGLHCTGAKVNRRLVPLRETLKNGDIIEVLTSPGAKPSRDWLKFVRTSKARNKIQHYFREREEEEKIAIGKEALEREVHRAGLPVTKTLREEDLLRVARALGLEGVNALWTAVADGSKVSAHAVLEALVPGSTHSLPERAKSSAAHPRSASSATAEGLLEPRLVGLGAGGKSVLLRIATCCKPLPGDPIWGFVTRGRGVSIHRTDCRNAAALVQRGGGNGLSQVAVAWEDLGDQLYDAVIEVSASDRTGLLGDLAQTIASRGVPISAAQTRTVNAQAVSTFTVKVRARSELDQLLTELSQIPGVAGAHRATAKATA